MLMWISMNLISLLGGYKENNIMDLTARGVIEPTRYF